MVALGHVCVIIKTRLSSVLIMLKACGRHNGRWSYVYIPAAEQIASRRTMSISRPRIHNTVTIV